MAQERVRPDDCALYFVDDARESTAQLSRLQLDEFGRVANWPSHFFGDAIGETDAQMRQMLERIGGGQVAERD